MEKLIQRASRAGGLAIYCQTSQAGTFYRVFRTRRRRGDQPLSTHLELADARAKVATNAPRR